MINFIRQIKTSTQYPFKYSYPAEYPSGLIKGLSIVYPYISGKINLIVVEASSVLVSMSLNTAAETDDVTIKLPTSDTSISQNIYSIFGEYIGRIHIGPTRSYEFKIEEELELSSSVFLPEIPGEDIEIRYSGDNGVLLELDKATNKVIITTDDSLYSVPLSSIEGSRLKSNLDEGISTLGKLSAKDIMIEIEGFSLEEGSEKPEALRFVYKEDEEPIWPGCGKSTIFQDNVRCSQKDGSSNPYPLDADFCTDEDDPVCDYKWEG